MRIGELAAAAGVQVETVRFYEREGLLAAPPRLNNGYRRYNPHHLERLTFIRHCRTLDIGLGDVRHLLHLLENPSLGCQKADTVVDDQLAHVTIRISELQSLKEQLEALRARCARPSTTAACGILGELADGGHRLRDVEANKNS